MNLHLRTLLTASFLAFTTGCLPASRASESPEFRAATLEIVGVDGSRHTFKVDVADTELLRRHGLMFRTELPADHGMLLWYDAPVIVNIWMKNTAVPLDILFIDDQWVIVRVTADAVPHSTAVMNSGVPVRAVLEIPAGQAGSLGIREGDRVIYAHDQ